MRPRGPVRRDVETAASLTPAPGHGTPERSAHMLARPNRGRSRREEPTPNRDAATVDGLRKGDGPVTSRRPVTEVAAIRRTAVSANDGDFVRSTVPRTIYRL